MTDASITLDFDDPVVFAKCGGNCSKMGRGQSILNIYYMAYTRRRWDRKPVCENCKKPMVKLYEVQGTKERSK